MEHKVIMAYNLVDSKGNKLQLQLGYIKLHRDVCNVHPLDQGYRWRFIGKHIPMPIRSREWFNGFPEPVMLNWLKVNDWHVQTRVNMCDGSATAYEVPKGNENPDGLSDALFERSGDSSLKSAVRIMCKTGHHRKAYVLYRYVKRCNLEDAIAAVREIVDEQN